MKLFFHVIHEDQPTGTTNVKEKTMGVTTTKKFREFTWNYFGERNETVYPCIPPPPPSHLGKRGSWILHGTITNIRNLHGNNKRRTEWNCFFHVIHEPLVNGDCECERKKWGLPLPKFTKYTWNHLCERNETSVSMYTPPGKRRSRILQETITGITTTKIQRIYLKPVRRTEWSRVSMYTTPPPTIENGDHEFCIEPLRRKYVKRPPSTFEYFSLITAKIQIT